EWGSESVSALFAQRRRLFDPRHWRLLVEVVRFLRQAERDLPALHAVPAARAESLDAYLERRHVSRDVRGRFVVPLAAALWSLAPELCGAFPAVTYVGFLDHHGMLRAFRPLAWRTIVGGSARYIDALVAHLRARGRFALHLATPVATLARDARGIT